MKQQWKRQGKGGGALQEFPKPLLENIWMMEGMEWESSVELQKSIVKPESRLTWDCSETDLREKDEYCEL